MANPRDNEVQKLLKKLAKAGPVKPPAEFFKEMKRREF